MAEITKKIELQPFSVPNFVSVKAAPGRREDGLAEAPKYKLADLEPETLDALCVEFRREVFEKAGKPDPRY